MSCAEFDYIVVGAGSAGCVMAARLYESGPHSVLLLETGPSDTNLRATCRRVAQISGTSNVPVIMVAENAADLVRQDETA